MLLYFRVEKIMDIKKILGLNKPDIKKMEREKDIIGLTRLLKFDQDESVRREAAFAIGKITAPNSEEAENDIMEKSVEELVDSLKSEDVKQQKQAARELIDIGKPALKTLIKSLKDENWKVRWYSAEILGEIGDEKAVPDLIVTMGDEMSGVRSKSMLALVEIGEPSVDLLISSLTNENWQIRRQAAEALGVISTKKAVEALIVTLNDENSWVQKTVAESLGNIGDKRAVDPLKTMLKNDNLEVQEAVSEALRKLG